MLFHQIIDMMGHTRFKNRSIPLATLQASSPSFPSPREEAHAFCPGKLDSHMCQTNWPGLVTTIPSASEAPAIHQSEVGQWEICPILLERKSYFDSLKCLLPPTVSYVTIS